MLSSHTNAYVYWKGSLVKAHSVQISPYDQGFLYGASLFTTFAVDPEGRIPFWDMHRQRLQKGCAQLGISLPETFFTCLPGSYQQPLLQELLRKNSLERATGRIRISAGEAGPGLPRETTMAEPRELLDLRPREAISSDLPTGKPWYRLNTGRDAPGQPGRLKSGAYLNSWLGHRELRQRVGDAPAEGVFLNPDDKLCEGVASNLFWIRDGVLRTPDLSTGCLPGTVREWLLLYAQASDVPVEEGAFTWDELTSAETAFSTNAVQGLVPATGLYGEDNQLQVTLPPLHSQLRHWYLTWRKVRYQSMDTFPRHNGIRTGRGK